MITSSAKHDKISILGAGIQGLALGFYLKRAAIPFHIYEKSCRVGGWIDSFEEEGFFFERGPRGFSPNGKGVHTLQLIRDLRLENEVIGADLSAKKRYILHKGALREMRSFPGLILAALFRDLCAPRGPDIDESVESFFQRRIGKQATALFIDAMTTGIYAGDSQLLSMRYSFPELYKLEKGYRSLLLGKIFGPKAIKDPVFGKYPLVTLKGGLRRLIEALYEEVKESISFGVSDQEGIRCFADTRFKAASLTVLHVAYRNQVAPAIGFGYLVPSSEKENVLGMVFDSVTFPEQNSSKDELRLTLMFGGTRHPELAKASDEKIFDLGCDALKRHLGLGKPDFFYVSRALDAIAQIPVGEAGEAAGINQSVYYSKMKFEDLNLQLQNASV